MTGKQEDILQQINREISDLRVEVTRDLGELRGAIDVLNTRLDTHLDYIGQAIDNQGEGLDRCHEELFGVDGHSGMQPQVARLEERLRHIWWLWTSIIGLASSLIFYWVKQT